MRSRLREHTLPLPAAAAELAIITFFAGLTAAGAQVRFHLPFTPVPVTGQVFCVLLAGAVLGARRGFLSQLEYLAVGAAGAPVFSQGGGLPALLGATGGYLVAFPLAAWIAGAVADRARAHGFLERFFACLAGVVVIYTFGMAWYAVWAVAILRGASTNTVLAQSVYPFIAVDVVKAGLAAAIAARLRRRPSP